MNISELARTLRVNPQELRDQLPRLGYDIGQKAIKINNTVASRIIKDWPMIRRRLEREKEMEAAKRESERKASRQIKTIELPKYITVKDLSVLADVQIKYILAELMKNGIFASLNERIDYDTAWLIGAELGYEAKPASEEKQVPIEAEDNSLKESIAKQASETLQARPPVIVVMGHVDHGKTKLLDAIRKTNVVAGEAGGITQHIGAYQITRKNRLITFIDTPGHEAFTAMRSRGARIADIAILVVAADDGVMPQTVEAFRIIESAKIPFVVAINKIDKPEANLDKVKQELASKLNIITEDWGGKAITVPVSALAGQGIDNLLDMVLLVADTESAQMKANPDTTAIGTIVESHLDKGAGPVATILVQNGTLKIGETLIANGLEIGRVRRLNAYDGKEALSAAPSMPVQIIGLKHMPQVGDIVAVGHGEKIHTKKIKRDMSGSAPVSAPEDEHAHLPRFNIVIKSDVLGSIEAIEESLEKINGELVRAKIIHRGLGNITEGDVARAESAGAQIYGFNVKCPPMVEEAARSKGIAVKGYRIIYDLLDDVRTEMEKLIQPEIIRHDLGKLKVLAVFRTEKRSQIVGGRVLDGIAEKDSQIEIWRQGEFIDEGKMSRLQAGKIDVKDVEVGQECGIAYEGNPVIMVDDELRFFKIEKRYGKLK